MMHIGVSSPAVKEFDKSGVLKANEVELIEVALDKISLDKDIAEVCLELKDKYGTVFTAHAPYHTSLVEKQRINLAYVSEKNFKIMKKVFETCSRIGAKYVVTHGGALEREYEYLYEKGIRNLIRNLKRLCKEAEKYEIFLVLENTHSDQNYRKLAETPREIKYIVETVASENLVINIDFGHANISSRTYNFNFIDYFNLLSDKIVYMHLHNNNGKEDMHYPLFSGSIDYKAVLPRIVKKLKNLRNIVLEVKYGGREGIVKSIEVIRGTLL